MKISNTAERLKIGMDLRNLKQVDIVEMTDINKGALSSYLSGKYEPKQNNIYKLASVLNVSEAWLMGYDVPMERTPTYIIGENGEREVGHNNEFNKNKTELLTELGIISTNYIINKNNEKIELTDNEYEFLINSLNLFRKK